MRFGDGAWRMLPGVNPSYLTRVEAVTLSQSAVVLNVFSRVEKERWATLFGHMFTVTLTSPSDNVVRVQITHHKGRKKLGPDYVLQNADPRALAAKDLGDKVEFVL